MLKSFGAGAEADEEAAGGAAEALELGAAAEDDAAALAEALELGAEAEDDAAALAEALELGAEAEEEAFELSGPALEDEASTGSDDGDFEAALELADSDDNPLSCPTTCGSTKMTSTAASAASAATPAMIGTFDFLGAGCGAAGGMAAAPPGCAGGATGTTCCAAVDPEPVAPCHSETTTSPAVAGAETSRIVMVAVASLSAAETSRAYTGGIAPPLTFMPAEAPGATAGTPLPHFGQNLAPSFNGAPQVLQNAMLLSF